MIVLQFSLHGRLSAQSFLCSDTGYGFCLDSMIPLNLPEVNFAEVVYMFSVYNNRCSVHLKITRQNTSSIKTCAYNFH